MAATFGDCWRRVRLYVPDAPTFLVREWVNDAYKKLTRGRSWAFLRGELDLIIQAQRSLASVAVTQSSTTVTSAGLFLAADAGRQFRVNNLSIYTVQTFTDANTIVLDRAYADADNATAAATIYDGYAVLPADFSSFRLIADPYNHRRLPFWITEDELNIVDPGRTNSDSGPRCLVAASPSTYTPTLGQLRYEYWPKPTSARAYPALYNKQAANLDDTSVLHGVLADGEDAIVKGALHHAARWPGTQDKPNPYFNLGLSDRLQTEFDLETQKLALKDDTQYPEDLQAVHWERWPLAELAYDDHALRASDALAGY